MVKVDSEVMSQTLLDTGRGIGNLAVGINCAPLSCQMHATMRVLIWTRLYLSI